jgi:arabinofuranosyltransferase
MTATVSDRETEPERLSGLRVRVAQGAVVAVPLVFLAFAGWAHRWTFDDGFIYLRVVRQIRVGHGPVFNTGQRVEVFTSPLWVAVLAVADLLTPLRLEWLAVFLGILGSLLGGALAIGGAFRLMRLDAPREFCVPVGIVVFAAVTPVWYFETSGLETGLVFAWLGACTLILASWARTEKQRMPRFGFVLIGLGWLVRPELLLDSLVFVALVLILTWREATWPERLAALAWTAGVPLAYQVFRMGYYGSAVANTAIAKEGSRLRVDTGWSYFQDFVRPYWLWVPIVLLVAGVYVPLAIRLARARHTRAAWVLAAFVLAAVANAGAVVGYGGDYLHGRLLLPVLFALCAPVAVVPVTARYVASLGALAWALLCLIALRPPETRSPNGITFHHGIGYTLSPRETGRVTLADAGWGRDAKARKLFAGRAVFINKTGFGKPNAERIDPPYAAGLRLPTVVSGGIGALGYALGPDVSILDLNGLADPLTAHLQLVRRGQTGHEKLLPPAWIAARVTAPDTEPAKEAFYGNRSPETPTDENMPFPAQVKWARAALQCPAIADLSHSTQDPLTPGRFLSNVLHSLSRARRRIPADPHQAYLRYCGPFTHPPTIAAATLSPNSDPRAAPVADVIRGARWPSVPVGPIAPPPNQPAHEHHQRAAGPARSRAPPGALAEVAAHARLDR